MYKPHKNPICNYYYRQTHGCKVHGALFIQISDHKLLLHAQQMNITNYTIMSARRQMLCKHANYISQTVRWS